MISSWTGSSLLSKWGSSRDKLSSNAEESQTIPISKSITKTCKISNVKLNWLLTLNSSHLSNSTWSFTQDHGYHIPYKWNRNTLPRTCQPTHLSKAQICYRPKGHYFRILKYRGDAKSHWCWLRTSPYFLYASAIISTTPTLGYLDFN